CFAACCSTLKPVRSRWHVGCTRASTRNIETRAARIESVAHLQERKNMKQFENKVVLVTGGTSGIGRDSALAFAREGARVVVSGRREKEGAETVAQIRQAGGQALFVQADVSREDDVANLIGRTVEAFGRLDIAFNNAGTEGDLGPLSEATTDNYQKIFDANVKGVFLSIKHETAQMLKQGGGAIVNNASVAGLIGFPGAALYVASKHAVLG